MEKSILKNTVYKLILEILRVIIPIITIPYVYRIFNPKLMGNVEISQAIMTYFSIFAGFGVYTYGLREISYIREKKEERNKIFTELFLISMISSILVSCVYYLYIIYAIKDPILKKILLVNTIQLFSYIFFIEWINEAFENYRFISIKTVLVKVINFLCVITFVKTEKDIYLYTFLVAFFVLLNNLLSFFYIRKYIKFDFKNLNLKRYLKSLILIIIMTNATIFYTLLDRTFLIKFSKNLEEIAFYGMAYKLVGVLTVVITSAILVSVPRLSFYIGANREEEYKKLFSNLLSYTSFILYPVGIGLILLSKEIVLLFGGKNYEAAANIMMFFSIRFMVATIQSIVTRQVLFVYKKEKILTIIYLVCGLLNLIFKVFLVKFAMFNAISAIITTTIAEIIILVISIRYIKKIMKLKMKILKIKDFKYLFISLFFFLINFFSISEKIIYKILGVIFFSVSFYTIVLIFLRDDIIIEILGKIRNIKKYKRGSR